MQCIARWYEDPSSGAQFRDQTILQFGASWKLIANLILLNPGSARPSSSDDQTERLRALGLPYFVPPPSGRRYLPFRLGPVMRGLLRRFAEHYDGGALRIFNLLNLRSSKPDDALAHLENHSARLPLITPGDEIHYGDAPVAVASGRRGRDISTLQHEMAKHTTRIPSDRLFALRRTSAHDFAFVRVSNPSGDWVASYHSFYTLHPG